MKKLSLILINVVAALAVAGSASAQSAAGNGTPPPAEKSASKATHKPRQTMLDVLAKLDLTADQQAKLKDMQAKNLDQVKDLRKQMKDGKLSKEDAKKKMVELRKANQSALKSILTTAQSKEFARLLKEARHEKKKPGG